jgi:hypothetical protein
MGLGAGVEQFGKLGDLLVSLRARAVNMAVFKIVFMAVLLCLLIFWTM